MDLELLKAIWEQSLGQLAQSLPRVATILLVMAVGWIAARLLASLVGRLVKRSGLDDVFEQSGLAQALESAHIDRSLSRLASGLIFWLLWLYIILATLAGSGQVLTAAPYSDVLSFLPRILAAFLVLVAGILLAQLLGRGAQTAAATAGVEFHATLGQGLRWLLIGAALILAVQQLGIDLTALTNVLTNLLTVVAAGLALAFGLGARGVVRNILAGHYAREQFTLGDQIEYDGKTGTLDAIGTVAAEIAFPDGLIVIPNYHLTEKAVRVLKTE